MRLKVHRQFVLIIVLVWTSRFRPGVSKPLEPFGYISVDCGGTGGKDPITGLHWDTDEDYLQSAVRLKSEGLAVSSEVDFSNSTETFRVNAKQLETAMVLFLPQLDSISFTKYCYSFNLSLSNRQSRNYLVRAVFPNTNLPSIVRGEFDFSFMFVVDATVISTITLDDHEAQTVELLATALTDRLDICFLARPGIIDVNNPDLSNTDLLTTLVAILTLEVRSLPETLYPIYNGEKLDSNGRTLRRTVSERRTTATTVRYYVTVSRLNFGGDESSPPIRYPSDPYDRLWYGAPLQKSTWYQHGNLVPVATDTGSKIKIKSMNSTAVVFNKQPENSWIHIPPVVLTSAWEGATDNATISFTMELSWWSTTDRFLQSSLCLAFFDVDADKNNSGLRSVDINNTDAEGASQWTVRDAKVPETGPYIWSDRMYEFYFELGKTSSTFKIFPAAESTRPVMVNALELYAVVEYSSKQTDVYGKTREKRTHFSRFLSVAVCVALASSG
ncbi:hypothetical protein R1sor_003575 [Riccia sorocarpa]|uniref:Malectin-like domain-containing protein n=1 Tax=Riccia sorocarpa TaxID=122646 RepID=A0ABD3H2T0_9MARC